MWSVAYISPVEQNGVGATEVHLSDEHSDDHGNKLHSSHVKYEWKEVNTPLNSTESRQHLFEFRELAGGCNSYFYHEHMVWCYGCQS